jgi:hypothetical protein
MLDTVEHCLPFALLNSEKLIEPMDLGAYVLTGPEAHHDELAVLRSIQNRAKA